MFTLDRGTDGKATLGLPLSYLCNTVAIAVMTFSNLVNFIQSDKTELQSWQPLVFTLRNVKLVKLLKLLKVQEGNPRMFQCY